MNEAPKFIICSTIEDNNIEIPVVVVVVVTVLIFLQNIFASGSLILNAGSYPTVASSLLDLEEDLLQQ